jgi:hypothetical protein
VAGLARLRALLSTWRALLSNQITNYNYDSFRATDLADRAALAEVVVQRSHPWSRTGVISHVVYDPDP